MDPKLVKRQVFMLMELTLTFYVLLLTIFLFTAESDMQAKQLKLKKKLILKFT